MHNLYLLKAQNVEGWPRSDSGRPRAECQPGSPHGGNWFSGLVFVPHHQTLGHSYKKAL